ncbi:MAG: hypothetical protein NTW80_05545, partial [Deltaproteobacteria bacterium]|nr:hypothetical protein [Deltaproteobacteria bacterium]
MSLSLNNPWVILILALLWGGSLVGMRLWTRRQLLRSILAREAETEIPLPPEPRPEDETVRELIRTYRDGYLWNHWPDTALSFNAINDLSLKLIREIAGVYYPEEERPELKASLADLVAFHNRVGSRLAAWLERAPIRPFKEVELQTIIRYYDMYQNVMDHPVSRFIQRHRLHKVAKWSWAAFNYSSPFYWGRQAAYELGRR